MIDQFLDWLKTYQGEIEHVGTLLATELSSEPADLIDDLTTIEAWGARIGSLLASANAHLDRSKLYYLPATPDMRENERRSIVDEKVADIRKTRDILENYANCIKNRLMLGMSILRFEKPHADPNAGLQRKTAADILRG